MFEFNADGYGILQIRPNQASRPLYRVAYWSDTYYYKKLSVKIVFLVNDGLFEHFLINKVHENVEIRGIENIQIPFRTHGNVLFRTCYRMCSYVKFNPFSFFFQKLSIDMVLWLTVCTCNVYTHRYEWALLDFDGAEKWFLGTQGSPAKHAAENLFLFSDLHET